MDRTIAIALEALIRSCTLPTPWAQQTVDDIYSPQLNEFRKSTDQGPVDDSKKAHQILADAIPTFAPFGAARIAVYFGAAVEQGGDATRSGLQIAQAMRGQLKAVGTLAPRLEGRKFRHNLTDVPGITVEQLENASALEFVAQGLVPHLSHWPELHKSLRAHAGFKELVDKLYQFHIGAHWIYHALSMRAGELLLLVPDSNTGFRIAYQNIASNFHLFTLLQASLGDHLGFKLDDSHDDSVNEAYCGNGSPDVMDTAIWDYSEYGPFRGNPVAWVRGEASPETISSREGNQIIVLWPRTIGRSWNGSFFPPRLEQFPAVLKIRERLSPEEAKRWINPIK